MVVVVVLYIQGWIWSCTLRHGVPCCRSWGLTKRNTLSREPCHMNDLSGLFVRLEAHSEGGLASAEIYPASLDTCLRPKVSSPLA